MTRTQWSPSPALRERVAAGGGPRTGEDEAAAPAPAAPSPSQRYALGPSLSRNAGEG